jgi:uncharacterized protein YegP (UPF0339 family)
MNEAQVYFLTHRDAGGEWCWSLKVQSFVIARSSHSFATEAQALEEIRYVQRYAKDAEIAHSKFNAAA